MHISIISTSSGVECVGSALPLSRSPWFEELICLNANELSPNRHLMPNSGTPFWHVICRRMNRIPRRATGMLKRSLSSAMNTKRDSHVAPQTPLAISRTINLSTLQAPVLSLDSAVVFSVRAFPRLARCDPDFELRDPQPQGEL